jgi:hypothetical protein
MVVVRLGQLVQRIRLVPAFQRVRFPRPALVHQDDVALSKHRAEYFADVRRHLRRGLSRASGQEEERVRGRLGRQRRERDDVQ